VPLGCFAVWRVLWLWWGFLVVGGLGVLTSWLSVHGGYLLGLSSGFWGPPPFFSR